MNLSPLKMGFKLEQFELLSDVQLADDGSPFIVAKLRLRERRCPKCDGTAIVRNGFFQRHIPIQTGQQTTLTVHLYVPRYLCRNPKCNCTFSATIKGVRRGAYIPSQTIEDIRYDLRHEVPVSEIAANYGVSKTYVHNIADEAYDLPPSFHFGEELILGRLNSCHVKGGQPPICLIDGGNGRLIDIVSYENIDELRVYFKGIPENKRSGVRYLVTDLNKAYRDIARDFFPKATHIIDPSYLLDRLSSLMGSVLKRARKQQSDSVEKRFEQKHSDFFLCPGADIPKGIFRYRDNNGVLQKWMPFDSAVAHILSQCRSLNALYEALTTLRNLVKIDNACLYSEEANRLLQNLRLSETDEGLAFAEEMESSEDEVMRTFQLIESGEYEPKPYVQEVNAKTKTLIKITRGLQNFKRLRYRMLLLCESDNKKL